MPEVLAVSDVRNRWAEVFRQAVNERHPIAIERGRSERALLIGLDELELLITGYEFHPEAFFEPEAVSIWLPSSASMVAVLGSRRRRMTCFLRFETMSTSTCRRRSCIYGPRTGRITSRS